MKKTYLVLILTLLSGRNILSMNNNPGNNQIPNLHLLGIGGFDQLIQNFNLALANLQQPNANNQIPQNNMMNPLMFGNPPQFQHAPVNQPILQPLPVAQGAVIGAAIAHFPPILQPLPGAQVAAIGAVIPHFPHPLADSDDEFDDPMPSTQGKDGMQVRIEFRSKAKKHLEKKEFASARDTLRAWLKYCEDNITSPSTFRSLTDLQPIAKQIINNARMNGKGTMATQLETRISNLRKNSIKNLPDPKNNNNNNNNNNK